MIIKGFDIDADGNITLSCLDNSGERLPVDLTKHINERAEKIAAEAVAEHMRKYHGHQL